MNDEKLDISSLLAWDDGLPHPVWDLIGTWIEVNVSPDGQREGWVAACRQWLTKLASALGPDYEVVESAHFLMLASREHAARAAPLQIAEASRARLVAVLGDLADFDVPGKQVVLALQLPQDYYRYIAQYYPDGEYPGSGGVHIREGYPHVVVWGKLMMTLDGALAHEVTHAALHHLAIPQWLEEGLAQMLSCEVAGPNLRLNAETAERHRRHWGEHGLDGLWRGSGFHQVGEVQGLSYELAEILTRLLVVDARPRWFGWVRKPERQFRAFMQEASTADGGEAACRKHLGHALGDLAARFLGPGEWSPRL
jgi:hypothetical protein